MNVKKIFLSLCCLVMIDSAHGVDLRLYGGEKLETFLGVINADKFEGDSIWNQFGDYGSKFASKSIWNKFGDYGGKFSSFSPFNGFTSTPPAIFDSKGNFYGFLTINKSNPKRATFKLAELICSLSETAYDDLGAAYEMVESSLSVNFGGQARSAAKKKSSRKTPVSLRDLEGARLVAGDGTYLGRITWNDVAADSIFNSVGRYGSDVSGTSIWNDISRYGSDASSLSPFNDVASDPPKIIKDGEFVGYLTLNDVKVDAIHPRVLLRIVGDGCDAMYKKRLLPYVISK